VYKLLNADYLQLLLLLAMVSPCRHGIANDEWQHQIPRCGAVCCVCCCLCVYVPVCLSVPGLSLALSLPLFTDHKYSRHVTAGTGAVAKCMKTP